MKKTIITLFTILTILCSQTAFADKTLTIAGSGVKSISLPDNSVSATQAKADEAMSALIGTNSADIIKNMAANNIYLMSFVPTDKQPIQYTISSTDNGGLKDGSINNLSDAELANVKTNLKSVLEGIGYTVSSEKQETLGKNKFFLISGSIQDSASGKKLFCAAYATIQYDKLILLRALNYSGEDFSDSQLNSFKNIASSMVFEVAPKKEIVNDDSGNNTKDTKQASTDPASADTEAAATTESEAKPSKEADISEEAENNDEAPVPESEEKSPACLIVVAISAVVILLVVLFIILKKKKSKNDNTLV